jgi:ADP-ribose pyrophosphatase
MEKQLNSTVKLEGRIFDVIRDEVSLENGDTSVRDIVKMKSNASAAVALIDDDIIMVKQYRYVIGKELLELPAGKIDGEETPEVCMARELREEIGYNPKRLIPLTSIYPSPGCMTEQIHLFIATDLKEWKEKADDDERIEVIRMPFNKAFDMVMNNEIEDVKTIIGIISASRYIWTKGKTWLGTGE